MQSSSSSPPGLGGSSPPTLRDVTLRGPPSKRWISSLPPRTRCAQRGPSGLGCPADSASQFRSWGEGGKRRIRAGPGALGPARPGMEPGTPPAPPPPETSRRREQPKAPGWTPGEPSLGSHAPSRSRIHHCRCVPGIVSRLSSHFPQLSALRLAPGLSCSPSSSGLTPQSYLYPRVCSVVGLGLYQSRHLRTARADRGKKGSSCSFIHSTNSPVIGE